MSGLASKLTIAIRQLILNGEFSPGDRVAEIPLAEKLGVSRTPTRAAMSQLEQEGLLLSSATGGYTVRSFTLTEIREAIDVRGALEGLGAEIIAQRGLSRTALREFNDCLAKGDALVDAGVFRPEQGGDWQPVNLAEPLTWDGLHQVRLTLPEHIMRNAFNTGSLLGLHFKYTGKGDVRFKAPSLVITFIKTEDLLIKR